MTDARFPERWLNDRRLARLSDPAFRTFVLALAWMVSNRTDGMIESADLELVPRADPDQAAEIVASGLWELVGSSWRMVDFGATQTPRSQLEGLDARRANDAERARKYRRKKGESSRDASRDQSRDDRGQDRPGQAQADALPASAGSSIRRGQPSSSSVKKAMRARGELGAEPDQAAAQVEDDDELDGARRILSSLGPDRSQRAMDQAHEQSPDLTTRDLVILAASLAGGAS